MLPRTSWILSEDAAGMRNQAIGLAEAAGLAVEERIVRARWPWRHIMAALWPAPLSAIDPAALRPPMAELAIGCGGKAAAVLAALKPRMRVVCIQHPRLPLSRFDLVVVGRHDELSGPNVLVTRTALHRITPERLAAAAEAWRDRLAHLPRPLVAVLVGGSNGRFRLDGAVATRLAGQLAGMMRRDGIGLAVTPSRRTDPAAREALRDALTPLGAWVWDMEGENPYFGLLGLADAIVVTMDSVSMLAEAAATAAPVLVAELPGRSHRIGLFVRNLVADGRVRWFDGSFAPWPAQPMNDTAEIAAEMCRRLGY